MDDCYLKGMRTAKKNITCDGCDRWIPKNENHVGGISAEPLGTYYDRRLCKDCVRKAAEILGLLRPIPSFGIPKR